MQDDDVQYVDAVQVIKDNAVFQQDKALITQMMEWAWNHPRNLKKVLNTCKTIVTMNVEVASSCTYNLPKGDGVIGPSVQLARIIARSMGNMRCEQRVVAVEDRQVICAAMCFDLETNYAVKTEIRRSIWGRKGRYSDDLITLTGSAGAAIAFRNAVFQVVDPAVVDEIHSSAKRKVTGDLTTEDKLIVRRTVIVNAFKSSYGLTDEQIAKSVKKKLIEHITADDVLKLIGYENAIKTGMASFEEIFLSIEVKPTAPPDKSIERLETMIKAAKTRKDLEKLKDEIKGDVTLSQVYDDAWKILK